MPRRRHATWRIAYHVVWILKYGRKILRSCIAETLREAIRDKTRELGVETIALAVMPDHIHLIVSTPPSISQANWFGISRAIQRGDWASSTHGLGREGASGPEATGSRH